MELIFCDYGVEIIKRNNRFFLKYDAGEIVVQHVEIEISEPDATKAQISAAAAEQIIIDYQNKEMFGEDYMEKYSSRKSKPD